MKKLNCWEFKRCGREPGGLKTNQLGICPATTEQRLDGVNSGKHGGRSCWALAGTLSGGKVQGVFASNVQNCLSCDFYATVQIEEGNEFVLAHEIMRKLK